MKAKKWIVIACDPMSDARVRYRLKERAKAKQIDGLGRIVICKHKEEKKVGGVWKEVKVKSYPGYLLIHCDFTIAVRHLIETQPGVFGILPFMCHPDTKKAKLTEEELEELANWKPIALDSEEEARMLIEQQNVNKKTKPKTAPVIEAPKKECPFKIGQTVLILDGTFKGIRGTVKRFVVSGTGYFLTVTVTMLGRQTDVGVADRQVEGV